MQLDVLALVDGAALDARGALTTVGVSQRFVVAYPLPWRVVQHLAVVFTDEMADLPGQTFNPIASCRLVVRLLDPSGTERSLTDETVELNTIKAWSDLPLVSNIIRDVSFRAESHGVYVIEVHFTPLGGETITRLFPIYVVDLPRESPDGTLQRALVGVEVS